MEESLPTQKITNSDITQISIVCIQNHLPQIQVIHQQLTQSPLLNLQLQFLSTDEPNLIQIIKSSKLIFSNDCQILQDIIQQLPATNLGYTLQCLHHCDSNNCLLHQKYPNFVRIATSNFGEIINYLLQYKTLVLRTRFTLTEIQMVLGSIEEQMKKLNVFGRFIYSESISQMDKPSNALLRIAYTYSNFQLQSNQVEQEIQKWETSHPFVFYSRSSYLFQIVNQTLYELGNTQLVGQILHKMTQTIRNQQKWDKPNSFVYNSLHLSSKLIQKLEKSIGENIIFPGFISGTTSKQVLLERTSGNVILIIEVDSTQSTNDSQNIIYPISISEFSEYPQEEEILFPFGSKFLIRSLNYDSLTQTTEISLLYLNTFFTDFLYSTKKTLFTSDTNRIQTLIFQHKNCATQTSKQSNQEKYKMVDEFIQKISKKNKPALNLSQIFNNFISSPPPLVSILTYLQNESVRRVCQRSLNIQSRFYPVTASILHHINLDIVKINFSPELLSAAQYKDLKIFNFNEKVYFGMNLSSEQKKGLQQIHNDGKHLIFYQLLLASYKEEKVTDSKDINTVFQVQIQSSENILIYPIILRIPKEKDTDLLILFSLTSKFRIEIIQPFQPSQKNKNKNKNQKKNIIKVEMIYDDILIPQKNLPSRNIVNIQEAIKGEKEIKSNILRLNEMNICDDQLESVLTELDQEYLFYLQLQGNKLSYIGIQALSERILYNQKLEILDVSSNNIANEGAKILSILLRNNKTLKSLFIGNNKISCEGISEIGKSLKNQTTLKEIHFGPQLGNPNSNSFGKNSGKVMTEMLSKNSKLVEINFRKLKISNHNTISILKGLNLNYSLRVIDLSYNELSDSIIQEFEVMIKKNYILEDIYLYQNSFSKKGTQKLLDLLEKYKEKKNIFL